MAGIHRATTQVAPLSADDTTRRVAKVIPLRPSRHRKAGGMMPWQVIRQRRRQPRTVTQSSKLQDVLYEIRGPLHDHAAQLEAQGHRILKLNIGNPAPFGLDAPSEIVRDMIHALPDAQGYSDSKGILSARWRWGCSPGTSA